MTDAEMIKHLWTHKTQDHPVLSDEELMIERGKGVYLWTRGGKKVIDGFAGLSVVQVGHGREEIADAIRAQAAKLAYYPTTRQFSNAPAAELAAKLATLTPGDLDYTLYAVSGAEANERSIQIARHYWLRVGRPRKYKIIALQGGYHGGTIGTFGFGGTAEQTKAYEPYQWSGFTKVAIPCPFRQRDAGTDEEVVRRCADALADAVRAADPETVAAVIMEPVQGAGGFIIPPLGWLERVRDICDDLEILMIADEVITGFGRSGKWFGVQHEDVVPDLMSVAKGITSGYLPLSASIARAKIADAFDEKSTEENVHPGTYAGHPTSCAAALANLAIIERENLVENAARMGERLHEAVQKRVGDLPIVGEVRSRGLMLGVELVDPRRRDQPLDKKHVASLNVRAWKRGAVIAAAGSVMRAAPPLSINAAEIDELAQILGDSLRELQDELSRSVTPTAAASA
ncbi:MAG TPA: aminotransferase class III-fold pyridoxal phosphate-dependent enzyme [Burkholderiales bacterium]|nr:aminotransferase class III-fold pyridoxal phosphate-dependent enzyme [Burkholderiales bacterium]